MPAEPEPADSRPHLADPSTTTTATNVAHILAQTAYNPAAPRRLPSGPAG